jgi:signal peptidase I
LSKSRHITINNVSFVVGRTIVIAFLVGAFTLFAATFFVPRFIFHAQNYVVVSGSMVPEINIGDIVISDTHYDPATIKDGDVVTYLTNDPDNPYANSTIVHRVISAQHNQDGTKYKFVTKGDANLSSDIPITELDITGKVLYKVPYIGLVTNSAYSGDILLFIGLLMVMFGIRHAEQRKRRKK